eukprot:9504149-Pyramimonas_sp.AAC.1
MSRCQPLQRDRLNGQRRSWTSAKVAKQQTPVFRKSTPHHQSSPRIHANLPWCKPTIKESDNPRRRAEQESLSSKATGRLLNRAKRRTPTGRHPRGGSRELGTDPRHPRESGPRETPPQSADYGSALMGCGASKGENPAHEKVIVVSAPTVPGGPPTIRKISKNAVWDIIYDAFLSHDWVGVDGANHERVKQIHAIFKKAGLATWIDEEKMQGNVQETMMRGIDSSACVIVFITKRYIEKVAGTNENDNCKLEYKYAALNKSTRPLIPVLLDPAAKDPASWEGLVKFHLGGEMYFDLSKEPLESNQDAIAKLIQRIKEVAHAARR